MKSTINLIKGSCADQGVDVIVNAANRQLLNGGGICGAIFNKAGYIELQNECNTKAPIKDGQVVITGSYNINNCKAIIHAVGPDFSITPNAFKELFEAYYNSLKVLMDNNYHSISFPLISSGIFGGNLSNPVGESVKQCIRAYNKFINDYPNYTINVLLCAFSDYEYNIALKEYQNR